MKPNRPNVLIHILVILALAIVSSPLTSKAEVAASPETVSSGARSRVTDDLKLGMSKESIEASNATFRTALATAQTKKAEALAKKDAAIQSLRSDPSPMNEALAEKAINEYLLAHTDSVQAIRDAASAYLKTIIPRAEQMKAAIEAARQTWQTSTVENAAARRQMVALDAEMMALAERADHFSKIPDKLDAATVAEIKRRINEMLIQRKQLEARQSINEVAHHNKQQLLAMLDGYDASALATINKVTLLITAANEAINTNRVVAKAVKDQMGMAALVRSARATDGAGAIDFETLFPDNEMTTELATPGMSETPPTISKDASLEDYLKRVRDVLKKPDAQQPAEVQAQPTTTPRP